MISMKNIRSILNCEQIVHYPGQTLSTGRRVITCEYKEGGEGNQKSGLRKYRSI